MQAAPTQGRCLLSPSWPWRSPLHRLDQAGAPAAPRAELAMGTPADANVCIYRHLHFCWHCSSHGDRQLCAVRPVDNLPVAAVTMFSSPQSQTRWALLGRAAFMRGLTPKKQSRKQPKAGVSKPLPPPRAARHPLPRRSSHFAATAPQATHGAVKRRVPVRSHQAQLGHVPSPGVPPPQAHTHTPHGQGQHCLSPEPPGRLPRGRLAQPQRPGADKGCPGAPPAEVGPPRLHPAASAFPRVPFLDPVFGSRSSQTLPEAPRAALTKLPHCRAMDLCCDLPLHRHSHFRST